MSPPLLVLPSPGVAQILCALTFPNFTAAVASLSVATDVPSGCRINCSLEPSIDSFIPCRNTVQNGSLAGFRQKGNIAAHAGPMQPPPGERFLILLSQPEVTHADTWEICHGEPQGARMIPHARLSNTEQLGRERDAIVRIENYLDGTKRMARRRPPTVLGPHQEPGLPRSSDRRLVKVASG